jgi:GAF domain-containing protein
MNTKNIQVLEEELRFSQAIYRIWSSFVSLESIDIIINKALKELGQLCNSSRAYLFFFKEGGEVMDNTHEWCASGISPQIDNLKDLPTNIFPWWMQKLENGETINIENVDEMPVEADAEKKILQEQDIKSILVLPVYIHEKLNGFIGIDNVSSIGSWEKASLEYLRVASEILSSSLTRENNERILKERNKELLEANDNLKNAQNQLVQSEKMASIGQLAAGVAHEINNPVGFILSNLFSFGEYVTGMKDIISAYEEYVSMTEPENQNIDA